MLEVGRYLNSFYSLNSLIQVIWTFVEFPQIVLAYDLNFDFLGGNSIYDVLNTFRWPDAQTLGLDSSQVDALKSALTQELSIIQGPPGTGKTYVGLMIMKILLANKNSNAGRNNPLRFD